MADLKTIEAQLGSSRPKTAIIGACLRSVQAVLKNSGDNKILTGFASWSAANFNNIKSCFGIKGNKKPQVNTDY